MLAAFADGAQSEAERARIEQIVNGFSGEGLDVASVYQDVLGGKFSMAAAASQLHTPAARPWPMRWPSASAMPTV